MARTGIRRFPGPALHAEAARLEELRLAVFEELMHVRLAAGDHADVILQLERLTREHPYREELRALHMIALYRSGRQADALRAFQATRDVLGEDLGIVPSPRLRRLEEQILLQDPDLDPRRRLGTPPRRAAGSRTPTWGCARSARPITCASSVRTS